MDIWGRIIGANKLPGIREFSVVIDLNETMTITNTGKPTLEQTLEILDSVARLDDETALILPEGFLYRIDARTVRKNVRSIMLKRIKTKKEAIEQEITPEKLIKERIEQMREGYQIKPETLREDYAGINYRGIRDGKIKNYLICDAIEGYLHAQNASPLIEIRRYDTLENLLKSREVEKFSTKEKATIKRVTIRKEILKMGPRRRTMTEIPGRAREIILKKQAERIVKKVPDRHREKFYYNIKFRRLPEAFPDSRYPELNKEFYAAWTDFYTEPACNCHDKLLISYIRPGQIWQCVHEIAAFRKALSMDWQQGKPATYPDPYIAVSPFLKPTQEFIDYYMKWRNQVFVRKRNLYKHLAKVYLDIWPEKQVRRRKIELL